jgi:hypothetical protein
MGAGVYVYVCMYVCNLKNEAGSLMVDFRFRNPREVQT